MVNHLNRDFMGIKREYQGFLENVGKTHNKNRADGPIPHEYSWRISLWRNPQGSGPFRIPESFGFINGIVSCLYSFGNTLDKHGQPLIFSESIISQNVYNCL